MQNEIAVKRIQTHLKMDSSARCTVTIKRRPRQRFL